MTTAQEPGLALPPPSRVNSWLAAWGGLGPARAIGLHVFEGGVSNLTCRLDLDGAPVRAVVLRLQRQRGIFEPYDVIREARVLEALSGSAVPVPRVLAREPGSGALGAPFIVLEWVDAPHMGEAGPEASFPAFAAMVATIHRVDWAGLGLDFLGLPASPRDALLAEVAAIDRRRLRFAPRDALLAEAGRAIAAATPGDGRIALCQGDINVFNYLVRARRVVAVVDWEQARLSDPRSDVGQLVALSHLKGAPFADPAVSAFVRLYSEYAGAIPAGLEWFRARWLWELGVIYHGWIAFNGSSPWYSSSALEALLRRSLAEI
jgi:aminoglycoside phosphotransferase (APT) family kinase protein